MQLSEAIRKPSTALSALACYAKYRKAMLGYPVLVDTYSLRPMPLTVPSTLCCCNPSIMAHKSGWLATVRTHNWYSLTSENHYKMLEDRNELVNECWLINLNDEFRPTKKIRLSLNFQNHSQQEIIPFVRNGISDCRIFKFRDTNYLLGSGINIRDKMDTMLLGQLNDGDIEITVINSPKGKNVEKNWMPVTSSKGMQITAIYSVNPLSLVQIENGVAIEIDKRQEDPEFGEYRGSSQLVPHNGGMLCIVHRVIEIHWRRVYLHRFILFDENWEIGSLSSEFFIERKGIEFCAGLAHKGDRFVISYGLSDVHAQLVELPISLVDRLLEF